MHLTKKETKYVFLIGKLQELKLLVMILENQYRKTFDNIRVHSVK